MDFNELLKNAPTEAGTFQPLKSVSETDKDGYFAQKEFISRSDLLKIGNPNKSDFTPAYKYGSLFDKFFTEPVEWFLEKEQTSDFELLQLLRLKQQLKDQYSNYFSREYFEWLDASHMGHTAKPCEVWQLQKEVYRMQFEALEGVRIKARIKLDYFNRLTKHITDLKSTTRDNVQDFLADMKAHQLPLQGGYYTDVARASGFSLLVMSYMSDKQLKKALKGDLRQLKRLNQPPQIWLIEMTAQDLNKGRVQYKALVKEGVEKGLIATL